MNERPRMPVEEAIARILAAVPPIKRTDPLVGPVVAPPRVIDAPLRECLHRVLATDLHARYTHPAWRNSAMDGYAVTADAIRGATSAAPITLPVDGTIAAGDQPPASFTAAHAWRIMTGAPVPDGADTVVRVEDTDAGERAVQIRNDRDTGRNIRPRGEDFSEGTLLIASGTVLGPAHIAMAAANGHATLPVHRTPRIAILTSGNELVDVEQFDDVLAGRRIVNSNGYALAALVRDAGGEPIELGIAPDNPAAMAERIAAAPPFDALITCGGISVGAFDYTRDVVGRLGATLDFWRVRMRPGGPFGFGMLDDRPWFGLPGNPVSAIVTFEVFVRDAIRRMAMLPDVQRAVRVTMGETVETPGGLTHFLRVVIGDDGVARLTGAQGSGRLLSVVQAHALLIVPHDVARIERGTDATALLLDRHAARASRILCQY
jgi:molybdopterin molybdotransferase